MTRRQALFEEKSKIVFSGSEPGTLIQYFKDEPLELTSTQTPVVNIVGRGGLNNRISEFLHTRLQEAGIPTYFIKRLSIREQIVEDVDIWPIEVCVRNIATSEFAESFEFEDGERLEQALIEYYYITPKNKRRLISPAHLTMFSWACAQDIKDMDKLALRANDFMSGVFAGSGMSLASFRLRFGCYWDEEDVKIVIADELSSDTCEVIQPVKNADTASSNDIVHLNYQEIAHRLGVAGK